jgi:hypothetical protein
MSAFGGKADMEIWHGTIALDQFTVQSLWLSMFMSGRSRFGTALAERRSSASLRPGPPPFLFAFCARSLKIIAPSRGI